MTEPPKPSSSGWPLRRIACLNCGHPMEERGCKVRCPRCGIFYDCSDGMLPMPEAVERTSGLPPQFTADSEDES